MGINKVILVGHLGCDVDFRALPSGTNLAKFRVATTDHRSKDEDGKPRTEWHSIVAWGRTAELCQKYLHKGSQVYLEGSIYTSSWEKDGEKKYHTSITAFKLEFLGKRGQVNPEAPEVEYREQSAPEVGEGGGGEDVPF